LDALAGMRPLADMTVLVANAAMRIVDVARPFARDDLVRLSRPSIEVEDELKRWRQSPVELCRKLGDDGMR
jgi:hypothetical protein